MKNNPVLGTKEQLTNFLVVTLSPISLEKVTAYHSYELVWFYPVVFELHKMTKKTIRKKFRKS
jgi:hypothetical protein